ncbi:MAG: hypothetical protein QOJ85_4685, partial [Solirubrobacteraceae bacterium]|nr:hypothetical protein [Solirubrobacteraceae bacterium]
TAAKVKAAALAKYPGTVEGVVGLPNGSYVAHVLTSNGGEVHVLVNSQFVVVDARTGGPGGPGGPGRPGVPPQRPPSTAKGPTT